MEYKNIDMDSFARKKHFEHFNSLAYPYLGVCVNVDITGLKETTEKLNISFFNTILYLITTSANSVPEFRQRINDSRDGIIEFNLCNPSITLARPDNTYCYCNLDINKGLKEFVLYAEEKKKRSIEENILEDGDDVNSLYFISTIPWISFTGIVQPTPYPADSNPRFLIGKYFMSENKVLLPLSIQANHALVDGYHISQFLESLNNQISNLIKNNK